MDKVFDARAEHYAASKTNSWDKLRYDVWTANLEKHAVGPALHILDAGGGDGSDSVIWAKRGHEVTLLDPSPAMLKQAEKRAKAEEVADKLTLQRAQLSDLPSLNQTFDLVLCHNVLPYLDDIPGALASLQGALKSGGHLSIICLNRYSEPFRQAVQQRNTAAALAVLDKTTYTTEAFGIPVTLFTADEMIALAQEQGLELAAQYGVRCVNDYVPNEAKGDYDATLRLELALTGRYPYYLLARFFQLVFRRRGKG